MIVYRPSQRLGNARKTFFMDGVQVALLLVSVCN